jgi:hypothetical protein
MTDVLHEQLAWLADTVDVPPLDVADVLVRGHRRRRRAAAAVAAAVCVVGAGVGISAAALLPGHGGRTALRTATAGEAPQPTEARLRQVAAEATPPIVLSRVDTLPGGPATLPGADEQARGCCAEPWGAPGRTSLGEVGNGATGDPVRITWTAVSPALSDFEGDRLASGWSPPDPDPAPAPAPADSTKVGSGRDRGTAWATYSYGGGLHTVVWSRDGGLALLSGPGGPADPALRDRLVQVGRALLAPRPQSTPPPDGTSGPGLGLVTVPPLLRPRLVAAAHRNAGQLPADGDLLARADDGGGGLELLVGHVSPDGVECTVGYSQQMPASSFGMCGGGEPDGGRTVSDLAQSSGRPGHGGFLSGRLPAGTTTVRVSEPGTTTVTAPAFDGGPRWGHACFFLIGWSGRAGATVEALAGNRVIATGRTT